MSTSPSGQPPAAASTATPAPAALPVAISLDDVERYGALRFGVAVTKLIAIHSDGRRVSIELPPPAEEAGQGDGADDELTLTRLQVAIVQLFASRPATFAAKGIRIANFLKRPDGTLRKHLAGLMTLGVLSNDREGDGYGRGERFNEAVEMLGLAREAGSDA